MVKLAASSADRGLHRRKYSNPCDTGRMCNIGILTRKAVMEISALPRIRLNIRRSAVSTRVHASGEIPPRRRSSFQCGRVYVQSMDDSSCRLYCAPEVGLSRSTRSGPWQTDLLGGSTAKEDYSLWYG